MTTVTNAVTNAGMNTALSAGDPLDCLFADPERLRAPQTCELYTKKAGSSDTGNEDDDI